MQKVLETPKSTGLLKGVILSALLIFFLTACATAPLVVTARTTGIRGPLAPQVTPEGVLFQVQASGAVQVNIAGQFNGWSPDATDLTPGDNGLWTILLELKSGAKHRYKYLIDGSWLPDPENPEAEPDGFGGYNSIIDLKKASL